MPLAQILDGSYVEAPGKPRPIGTADHRAVRDTYRISNLLKEEHHEE